MFKSGQTRVFSDAKTDCIARDSKLAYIDNTEDKSGIQTLFGNVNTMVNFILRCMALIAMPAKMFLFAHCLKIIFHLFLYSRFV